MFWYFKVLTTINWYVRLIYSDIRAVVRDGRYNIERWGKKWAS